MRLRSEVDGDRDHAVLTIDVQIRVRHQVLGQVQVDGRHGVGTAV
jgi:hypothetical protein